MTPLYQEEHKKLDVITHLEELRKRILYCLAALAVASVVAFWQGDRIMRFVREPISGLVNELIFISPTEAFMAYVKVALLAGFVISFPLILYNLWAFISPALDKRVRGRVVIWLSAALLLFLAGVSFSYFLAIPAALRFLIGFSGGIAVAMITLGKYVSFFGALIVVGGITFQIPIMIGLLSEAGILKAKDLRQKRHYALIAVMIFAAVITPTQDILNMLLFALPMMALYEVGVMISVYIERKRP